MFEAVQSLGFIRPQFSKKDLPLAQANRALTSAEGPSLSLPIQKNVNLTTIFLSVSMLLILYLLLVSYLTSPGIPYSYCGYLLHRVIDSFPRIVKL